MSCLIRKRPIVFTPEEKVRQALLHLMIHSLGYPAALIGVELNLACLPNSPQRKCPQRRADIIVFTNDIKPLILIECKATPLTQISIRQVVGYNLFVQAPYLALANQKEIKTGKFQNGEWTFKDGLIRYENLIDHSLLFK